MTGGAERRRHLDRTVVTDSGESVCECCGLVVDTQAGTSGMRLAVRSRKDGSRFSGTTRLGHTSPEYDRAHHMIMSGADGRARNINEAVRPLRDICMRHGYGNAIHDESAHMLRWAYARDLMRHGHREAMSLACIYLAHHAHDVRRFRSACSSCGTRAHRLSSGCRFHQDTRHHDAQGLRQHTPAQDPHEGQWTPTGPSTTPA